MSYPQNQAHRRRRNVVTSENQFLDQSPNFDYQTNSSPSNFDPFRRRREKPKEDESSTSDTLFTVEPVVSLFQVRNDSDNFASSSSNSQIFDEMSSGAGDRTSEFRTIGKNYQLKLHANNDVSKKPKIINQILAETSRFNQYAKKIGADLSSTFAKLEKLTMLVRKNPHGGGAGLDYFDATEVDQLTHIVKLDIDGLNREIAQLQRLMAERQQSIQAKNGLKNQTASHSKSIVLGLQSKLASMSNEFKSVLETRTENLRQQKTRREKLGGGPSSHVPSSLPASASAGRLGSVLMADEYQSRGQNVILDLGQPGPVQSQALATRDTYVQSRANAMQNIESTIVDLGQIFSQLAHMVQEQGEMVQRIDSHVDEANLNVEAAHMQLLQYMRSISSNRWLALKVFGVLIVFFIIFIIFLA